MLTIRTRKPIVFAGASIQHIAQSTLDRIEVKSPIKRGDLEALLDTHKKPGTVIMLDGLYGANLAVTPTECRWLLNKNWQLIGAASMGALRASELWQQGMIGIGNVYMLYRLGYLKSDADVAVAYDKNCHEVTLSIVHIRAILAVLEQSNLLTAIVARKMILQAKTIPWFERHWDLLKETWKTTIGLQEDILVQIERLITVSEHHPKKQDATQVFKIFFSHRWVEK